MPFRASLLTRTSCLKGLKGKERRLVIGWPFGAGVLEREFIWRNSDHVPLPKLDLRTEERTGGTLFGKRDVLGREVTNRR